MILPISLDDRRQPAASLRKCLALLVVVLLASACGSDDPAASEAASAGGISVTEPWARPSPGGGGNTAFYMTITNDGEGADTFLSAQGEACGVTEIHMTSMQDGVTSMSPVTDGVPVTPGASVVLGPGALHVMCIDVGPELAEGQTTNLTLEFAEAGPIAVVADIRTDQ